jgi:ABC-type polysaccharide/polyol phosphate export permease
MIERIIEIYRLKYLIYTLVAKDLKVKYKGSILGFFWSLLNPLLMLIIYTVAFQYIIRIRVENFAIFFLCGFLPWTFLSSSLSMGVGSIIDNSNLVKKVFFPREILPVSTVFFNLIQFLLTFIILVPALFIFKIKLGFALSFLPFVIILQMMFVLGLSFILSSLSVFYRDIKHFLEIFLQVWFWLCPIIYPITMIPERFRFYYMFNPFVFFIESYRDILLENRIPSLITITALITISFIFLLIGYYVFGSNNKRFAEEV